MTERNNDLGDDNVTELQCKAESQKRCHVALQGAASH